eukprot:1142883-Pelagomonas_calceolata.AAC.1
MHAAGPGLRSLFFSFSQEGSNFKSKLQKRQSCKAFSRATAKFFSNSMLSLNSKISRQVLKADLHLADRDDSCWSAHVFKALSGMCNGDVFQQKVLEV